MSFPTLKLFLATVLVSLPTGAVAEQVARGDAGSAPTTASAILDRTIAEQSALTSFATHLDTRVEFLKRPADSGAAEIDQEIYSIDFRVDGDRYDAAGLRSDRRVGKADADPAWRNRTIWDGRRELHRQQSVGGDGKGRILATVSRKRRDWRPSYNNAPFLYGIARGDDRPMARVLRESGSGTATLRDKTEDVGGHACHVIDGKNERGTYTLWVDPAAGYLVRRAAVVRGPGDLWFGHKLHAQATGTMQNKSEETIDLTRIEKVGGRWVPVEAIAESKDHYAGGVQHTRSTAKRSGFELDPDVGKLGAFVMDGIPEGYLVAIMGEDGAQSGTTVWHNGDVVAEAPPAAARPAAAARAARVAEGMPAPETVGVDADGKPLRLGNYRGKVVALVFWGPWCGPCMARVPGERALVKALADKPFVLVGVANDDKAETVRASIEKERMTWPNFYDGGNAGPIQKAWGVREWPTYFVLDAKGVVRFVNPDNVDAAVLALLDEMGKE
jgi:thiol-disulfide isomerase/thioredoxin